MSRVVQEGSFYSTRCLSAAMRVVSLCRHVRLQRATVQHEECRPAQPCQTIGRRRRRASMLAPTCAGVRRRHMKSKDVRFLRIDMRRRLELRREARAAPKSRSTAELQNTFGLGGVVMNYRAII